MAETKAAGSTRKWDRAEIQAELKRRGMTQLELARRYGLYDCAISQALNGGSLRGAMAISDFLGVPLDQLFPDRYRRHRAIKPDMSAGASQNHSTTPDKVRAA